MNQAGSGIRGLAAAIVLWLIGAGFCAAAQRVVVIGDSLSAEYDTVELPSPFDTWFGDLPTDYARITVPEWESKSWVEILAQLRASALNFGMFTAGTTGHGIPRLSGYEYNWAIPGAESSHYASFVTSDVLLFLYGRELEDDIDVADVVVVWIGGNDFRATYGEIAEGDIDPDSVINPLIENLRDILDFIRDSDRNDSAKIIVANIPDIGAAPSKRTAHPNAMERQRVTNAIVSANSAIATLASSFGATMADVYSQSRDLVAGKTTYFGAVPIIDAADNHNDPRYHFTRDGLHPNTPSQIEIARIFLDCISLVLGQAAIPEISDSEALAYLGIDPQTPFFEWLDDEGLASIDPSTDTDGDGIDVLTEYAFDLSTDTAESPSALVSASHEAGGSDVLFTFRQPSPERLRHIRVIIEESLDHGTSWRTVSSDRQTAQPGGFVTVQAPAQGAAEVETAMMRMRLSFRSPDEVP